jgi:hypothetical protein
MESPRILFISKYREKETHILKLITATLVGLGIEQQQAATREKRYWLLHAPHFFFYLFTNLKAILYIFIGFI